MPLHLVRSSSNATLWSTCAERFLAESAVHPGPTGHRAHLWLTHRIQRDLLLEAVWAHKAGGWLNPPVQFLSALPQSFGITGKPIGQLARRERISRIGYEQGGTYRIQVGNNDATITRGNMLDALFGELLPEGVSPDALAAALGSLEVDEFGLRRNTWLELTYRTYLAELARAGMYDPRSIHALVASRIDDGGLPATLGGAQRLHIYGLYSARARRLLLGALARQQPVEVVAYTTIGADDLTALATTVEDLGVEPAALQVQPAPDAQRELRWVAGRVKELLLSGQAEPHEVAVVARTGLEDTRRALYALERAGIPATARVRTPLSEIAALKALLDLFRGPAENWSYRVLRTTLASPYLRTRVDLRPFDYIASNGRPTSLAEWEDALNALITRLENEDDDPDARRIGLFAAGVRRDVKKFVRARSILERLDGAKPLSGWLDLTVALLSESWFRFRQRICDPPESRLDVVRLDQRGVRQLESLIEVWRTMDDPTQVLSPTDWFRALRTLLDGQELVLTTPGQKGVQILEAHDAALVPFKALFLIHANDGEFPRQSSTAGLFSERERRALRASGLPLDDRTTTLLRERVLFAAVSGASQVFASYRTTDSRGTPLLPSLLLAGVTPEDELPRTQEVTGAPMNAEEDTRAAARRLALHLANHANPEVAAADPALLRRAIVNAWAERRRGAPERAAASPNPWNGELRDPAVLAWLGERYGGQHIWSASQLQTYTNCPFIFLVERVLGMKEIEEADIDTDVMTSGSIVHAVLERFYREFRDRPAPIYDASLRHRLVDASATVFNEWRDSGKWLGVAELWEQRRLALLELLDVFVQQDLKNLGSGQWAGTVWACEHELSGDAESVELTHASVDQSPVRILVRGRIDRIDCNRRGELIVIDYKSGSTPQGKSEYADGAVLQGPLYMHALRSAGHVVGKAVYRSLKSYGNAAALSLRDQACVAALEIAFTVPGRVRSGLFEAAMAGSQEWKPYHPDLSIRRTNALIEEGSRFDA